MRRLWVLAVAALALPAPASAGVRNVLPPGANGLSNPLELAAFLSAGARPAHNDDQRSARTIGPYRQRSRSSSSPTSRGR
ncbi:MAG: hypothetical protein QOD73_3093 [Solirubrobacteraceae bacterium]|nr:hypothetical protein [Solirubrobacteraceae bacterium]